MSPRKSVRRVSWSARRRSSAWPARSNKSSFPLTRPRWPAWTSAWRRSASTSAAPRTRPRPSAGIIHDFIPLSDGSLGIAIGDVSGHGVGPALLMAEARALLRAFAQTQADVSAILNLVNRVLVPDVEGDRFITLLLAKLNLRERHPGLCQRGTHHGLRSRHCGEREKSVAEHRHSARHRGVHRLPCRPGDAASARRSGAARYRWCPGSPLSQTALSSASSGPWRWFGLTARRWPGES